MDISWGITGLRAGDTVPLDISWVVPGCYISAERYHVWDTLFLRDTRSFNISWDTRSGYARSLDINWGYQVIGYKQVMSVWGYQFNGYQLEDIRSLDINFI